MGTIIKREKIIERKRIKERRMFVIIGFFTGAGLLQLCDLFFTWWQI